MEADDQLGRRGQVWDTLRRVAAELGTLGIPYAVAGGIALQHHDVPRSTQDVDLLIPGLAELERIHQRLVGRGFSRKAPTSRHLRDDVTRVRVEFLIGGEFPGDGQPKPVAFPAPQSAAERDADGISFLTLPALIELKLASAMSAPHRIKDRADVLELIHTHGLGAEYAARLNTYVRSAFLELAALPSPRQDD